MEIWNLVFMQFNRSKVSEGEYKLEPLPAPSVDTGAGVERMSAVIQGVKSTYDTDLIKPIIEFIAKLAGQEDALDVAMMSGTGMMADTPEFFAMRVIADHARTTAFSIADGIAPGNVSRNYVLRKIMRRAIYHGVKGLGLKSPFFNKVTAFVGDFMGGAYPELISSRHLIEQTVRGEEQRFSRILNVGEPRLAELFDRYHPAMPPMLELARTYDTYGVPRDLIRVELGQHGTEIDEEDFNEAFDAALRELQQQTGATMAEAVSARRAREIYTNVAGRLPRTEFRGYEETETANARVIAIIVGDEERERLAAEETGEVILDRSPFYAEAGGQIGDTGMFEGENLIASVEDTYAVANGYYLHKTKVERGELRVGDQLYARVDGERRRRIRANHTGTHLLHAALREVLGPHVKQAGSLVAPDRLRFDFTHYAPLTEEEIAEVERLVNTEVLLNRAVETEIRPLEEALKSGAMALFGEKYASDVRVVSVAGFSTELCGGTHVRATGDIGPFKITSDQSIAAGVRRLEAVTADAAIARFQNDEQVIEQLSDRFKTRPEEIPAQVDKLVEQVRRYEREIEQLRLKIAQTDAAQAADNAREINGVRVLARRVSDLDSNGMRQLADTLSRKLKSGVVVLGQATNGKASLVARVTDDLTERLNAGQIVREVAAIIGGKGGGRADMATGGGSEPEKLDQALDASYETVERMLGAKQ
jgi:alanyl-tRNA synthetase